MDILKLYQNMLAMRLVEEKIAAEYPQQKMRCPTHLSIGQEYTAACIQMLKQSSDQGVSTHRPHAHYLGMGGDLSAMIDELYGLETGCSSGRGGSMHLIDESVGFMGSTAIVGNSIPLGVGLAFAKKINQKPGVVFIYLGDAAVEEGAFYESVNFALIHKLAVLFVCENNGYSVYANMSARQPEKRSIFDLAKGLGLNAYQCDGYDLDNCYQSLQTAIDGVRSGGKPSFIEIATYRFKAHCGVSEDDELGYRDPQEIKNFKDTDPLKQLKALILDLDQSHFPTRVNGKLWLQNIKIKLNEHIDQIFKKANADYDQKHLATSDSISVFKTQPTHFDNSNTSHGANEPQRLNLKHLTYTQAVQQALHQCMEKDNQVVCYGLGINDPKGIFETTTGLIQSFGEKRVFDMPTAENAMLGIGIGAAINGLKPVMMHQRFDFFLLAMDQLVNNAAKWFFTYGRSIPICIRLIVGRGWGQGPTHSQMLASWLAHIPGLKVVMPSTAYDAKGLLISAIEDENPVIVIEHRWSHSLTSLVPNEPYRIPLSQAKIIKSGNQLTLVSASYYSIECLKAAESLAKTHQIQIEVIDLRSIAPLDVDLIHASVIKTKRLLIVDPGWAPMGIGSEIISCLCQAGVAFMAPPKCISLPHHPSPSGYGQSKDYYPNPFTIAENILNILGDTKPLIQEAFTSKHLADVPNLNFTGPF